MEKERERERCTQPGIRLVHQVQGEVRLKARSNNTHMAEKLPAAQTHASI